LSGRSWWARRVAGTTPASPEDFNSLDDVAFENPVHVVQAFYDAREDGVVVVQPEVVGQR